MTVSLMVIVLRDGEGSSQRERESLRSLEIFVLGSSSNLTFVRDHGTTIIGPKEDLVKLGQALEARNWRDAAIIPIPEDWEPEKHLLTLINKIHEINIF